jgi:uncharacterized membrane protein YfcA
MLYRENGQFKSSYRSDSQVFPILQDRIGMALLFALAVVGVPLLSLFFAPAEIVPSIMILAIIAGLTGGAAAMPGPSVIFLFLAVPIAHEAGRASLILFFQVSAAMSAVSATFGGLMQVHSLILGAMLVPAMLVGNALGDRVFDKASAKTYRRVVVLLLAGLGAVAAVRGFIGLVSGA